MDEACRIKQCTPKTLALLVPWYTPPMILASRGEPTYISFNLATYSIGVMEGTISNCKTSKGERVRKVGA